MQDLFYEGMLGLVSSQSHFDVVDSPVARRRPRVESVAAAEAAVSGWIFKK